MNSVLQRSPTHNVEISSAKHQLPLVILAYTKPAWLVEDIDKEGVLGGKDGKKEGKEWSRERDDLDSNSLKKNVESVQSSAESTCITLAL